MDERDFQLFTTVFQEPFVSNEELGRRFGLSGAAVKTRFLRMETDIELQGYRAIPSPSTLGRIARGYFFQVDDEPGLLDPVCRSEDVVWVVRHHDRILSVLTFEKPDSLVVPELTRLLGSAPIASVELRLTTKQAPAAPLSPLDWRVLRAMVADARRSFLDIAKDSGLSRKTVASRAHDLFEQGAYTLSPLLCEARSAGALVFHLAVFGRSPDVTGRARQQLQGRGVPYAWLTRPPGVLFVCYADSAAEALNAAQRVGRIGGVDNVVFNIPRQNAFAQVRVLTWIDEALETWRKASPRAQQALPRKQTV